MTHRKVSEEGRRTEEETRKKKKKNPSAPCDGSRCCPRNPGGPFRSRAITDVRVGDAETSHDDLVLRPDSWNITSLFFLQLFEKGSESDQRTFFHFWVKIRRDQVLRHSHRGHFTFHLVFFSKVWKVTLKMSLCAAAFFFFLIGSSVRSYCSFVRNKFIVLPDCGAGGCWFKSCLCWIVKVKEREKT